MPVFRYTDDKIFQFVKALKTIDGGKLIFKDFEKNSGGGKTVRVSLSSDEIGGVSLELHINAPIVKQPTKYHAALLADLVRIRGVDYDEDGRTRGFKTKIPKGWHQNIEYPNHPKDSRHDALDLGTVTDLGDFARKICALWNIELPEIDKQREMNL